MIEFKPYVFLADFKQWRISLWDPIYWTRTAEGLQIGGSLHSWEDQQRYDVKFKADSGITSALERQMEVDLEEGPLSKTYQAGAQDEQENRRRQDRLMRLTDRIWLACKYAAIRRIENEPLMSGRENECEIQWDAD